MDDTISILPDPGIKCCAGKSKDEEILLTGESAQCVCNHHVEQHCTRDHYDRTINRHCHGSNELCNCDDFKTRSVRLTHSNSYKMVTVRLAGDFEVLEGYQTQTMR